MQGALLLAAMLTLAAPARAQNVSDADRLKSRALTTDQRIQVQGRFKAAVDFFQAGDYAAARRDFEAVLAVDPLNVTALFYLADTLLRLGDTAAATAAYGKVIAIDRSSDMARESVGSIKKIEANVTAMAADKARQPSDNFRDCAQCPAMVVVPSGSFLMGSDREEAGHYDNESPMRTVTFARNFAVGKFAISFAEWDACAADGGCNSYMPPDNNWGRGKQPVIFVSWNNAKSYVAWLSRKTGKTYRLLSEAEREYVTRAGTTSMFWWGAELSPGRANYDGNYVLSAGQKGEFRGRPLPVDALTPNPWGLYQVHGNVLEWIEDCAADATWKDYSSAPSDGAPQDTADCKARMLRGGAWDDLPRSLRAAARNQAYYTTRNYAVGFRVARDLGK
jgi:formylglycine-generating enzyme required for sulfatase activity